ncbi:MAG: hypothetical protein U0Y68_26715 [Blastocatellia bacterium]
MDESTENDYKQPRGLLWLWSGVLAGPLAWALSQQVGYLFVTLDCSYTKRLALWPVMLGTILLAGAGAWVSWRNWQEVGNTWPDEGGGVLSRSRFLAFVGLLLSGFSVLVILAEWLPVLFYRQCQR